MPVRPIILYEDSMRLEARTTGRTSSSMACVIDEVGDPGTVRERLRDARPQNGSRSCWPTRVNLGPDQLKIFLLSKNIESVIAALRDCGHQSSQFEAALRKDLLARDSVLIGAARAPARFVRDCTRRKIPSLDEIVRDLAKVVST